MAQHSRPETSVAQDQLRDHPWWKHVPSTQRRSIPARQLKHWLRRRRSRIVLMALIYALICGVPVIIGGASLSLLAVLPMLLLPAVAGLTWWLTWKEFRH